MPWIHKMRPLPTRFARLSRCAQAVLILYLLLGSSCAHLSQAPPPAPAHQLASDAELFFLKGEYQDALSEFQREYETALAAEDRNQALYGLACTQIITARTDRELAEGIVNLQKWDEEKGTGPFQENRRLLVLAMKQQGEVLVKRNREQQRQGNRKDRLIANQKEQIAQLTVTIEMLQKQLEELEAIDENFQVKRKTL